MSGMASIQIKAGNTSHSAYNVVNKLPAENDYDLDNFTKSFFDTNEKITPTHILDQRKVAVVGNPMGMLYIYIYICIIYTIYNNV